MASPTTTPVPAVPSSSASSGSCCCGPSLAYLLLRVALGVMLMLYGVEKFKSPAPPYNYSFSYWHDTLNSEGAVEKAGKWVNVAKPVFEYGGFNNTAVYGEKTVNFFTHVFKTYAIGLPYAMIAVGFFILIGFLNRISLLLGGGIWISLAMGQLTLIDSPTVSILMQFFLYHVVAIALVKYNRWSLTRF